MSDATEYGSYASDSSSRSFEDDDKRDKEEFDTANANRSNGGHTAQALQDQTNDVQRQHYALRKSNNSSSHSFWDENDETDGSDDDQDSELFLEYQADDSSNDEVEAGSCETVKNITRGMLVNADWAADGDCVVSLVGEGLMTVDTAAPVWQQSAQAGRVRVMNLHANSLRDVSNLSGFHKLLALRLSSNNLSAVPWKCLLRMSNLRVLDLACNHLCAVEMPPESRISWTFPKRLEVLNLAFNNITSIGALAQAKSLRVLDLRDNRIDAIEQLEPLMNASKLTVLSLQQHSAREIATDAGHSICTVHGYRDDVLRLLVHVRVLDGIKRDQHVSSRQNNTNVNTPTIPSSNHLRAREQGGSLTPRFDEMTLRFFKHQIRNRDGQSKSPQQHTQHTQHEQHLQHSQRSQHSQRLSSSRRELCNGELNDYAIDERVSGDSERTKCAIKPKSNTQRPHAECRSHIDNCADFRSASALTELSTQTSSLRPQRDGTASTNNIATEQGGGTFISSCETLASQLLQALKSEKMKEERRDGEDAEASDANGVESSVHQLANALSSAFKTTPVSSTVKHHSKRCNVEETGKTGETVAAAATAVVGRVHAHADGGGSVKVTEEVGIQTVDSGDLHKECFRLQDTAHAQVTSLETKLQTARTQLVDAQEHVSSARSKVAAQDAEIEGARTQQSEQQQHIIALASQVSDTTKSLEVFKNRAAQLEDKARTQEIQLVELQQVLETQHKNAQESQQQAHDTLVRVRDADSLAQAQLAARAAALASKLRHTDKAKTALEVQVRDIHAEIEDVATHVQDLQRTVASQKSQLSQAKTRELDLVKCLEATKAKHATHTTRWRAVMRRHKEEATSLANETKQRDTHASQLEASLVAARTRARQLEHANGELVGVVAEQRRRLDQHARIHIDRRKQLDDATRGGEVLQTRLQQVESKLVDATSEAKAALERADASDSRVFALESRLEASAAQLAERDMALKREKDVCSQLVNDAEATVKIKNAMLEDQNRTVGEMRKTKEESEKNRERTTGQLREALGRAKAAENKADALEAEMLAQDNAIRDLEGIVDDLKAGEVTSEGFKRELAKKDKLLEQVQVEMQSFHKAFTQRDAEIATKAEALAEARDAAQNAQDEADALLADHERLHATLDDKREELRVQQQSLERQKTLRETEQERVRVLSASLETCKQETTRLMQELEERKREAELHQCKIDQQRQDIQVLAKSLQAERHKREQSVKRFAALYHDLEGQD